MDTVVLVAKAAICVTGRIPRKKVHAWTEIGIEVGWVDTDDVSPEYDVEVPGRDGHVAIRVVSHRDELWRPIVWRWTADRGHPSGEEARRIAETVELEDNPLRSAAFAQVPRDRIAYLERPPVMNEDGPERREAEVRIRAAARHLLFIGGIAHRRCAEPSWSVRLTGQSDRRVILQADVGSPGRSRDAVWFAADHSEIALRFADELATAKGAPMIGPRGTIDILDGALPAFDDVSFAELRLASLLSSSRLGIARIDPSIEEFADRDAADDQGRRALRIREAVEAIPHRTPEIEVLLGQSQLPSRQVEILRRLGVLRRGDEAALMGIEASSAPSMR